MTRLSCIDIDFSLSFSLFQFFFHFDCCCPYLFDFIQTHFNSAIQKIIYESLHNIFSIHYLSLCLAELWSFAIWSHFEMIDLFLNEWASECARIHNECDLNEQNLLQNGKCRTTTATTTTQAAAYIRISHMIEQRIKQLAAGQLYWTLLNSVVNEIRRKQQIPKWTEPNQTNLSQTKRTYPSDNQ